MADSAPQQTDINMQELQLLDELVARAPATRDQHVQAQRILQKLVPVAALDSRIEETEDLPAGEPAAESTDA